MKKLILAIPLLLLTQTAIAAEKNKTRKPANNEITIRTESYPRPPYSGAIYYIYERDGAVICTKLKVCNKYDDCETTYTRGSFKDELDIETGEPYGQEPPVVIPVIKQAKHVCLTRFPVK